MPSYSIRPLNARDRDWVASFVAEQWGSESVVVHGVTYFPYEQPGFVAELDGGMVGLLTYHIEEDGCEIVTLNSLCPSIGIGTALIEAAMEVARQSGCWRIWLITTNDNLYALRFYQKRGFTLVAIRPNALEESRKIKPEIPLIGMGGIPLRDEIELEMMLDKE